MVLDNKMRLGVLFISCSVFLSSESCDVIKCVLCHAGTWVVSVQQVYCQIRCLSSKAVQKLLQVVLKLITSKSRASFLEFLRIK